MAECHPVAFRFVMQARERGATVIHVDPRFTRTSAVANLHVPIRAGSDIAFLGALIRHMLENKLYFHDYVVNYTNAATILREDFQDTEDLEGLFSDASTWLYEGVEAKAGEKPRIQPHQADPTLEHPRCVLQVLKRHFSRYTPEMVAETCGVPVKLFQKVAGTLARNSGRERTSAFCYAVGWTQHTVGVQYIRTAAILQLLMGSMGRPGGGIMALRGHASIQGSTDIPTLFNLLPGYLPMPDANLHATLEQYIALNQTPNRLVGRILKVLRLLDESLVRHRGDSREQLGLRLPAAPDRRSFAHDDGEQHGRRQAEGLFRDGRKPRGRFHEWQLAEERLAPSGLAGGA